MQTLLLDQLAWDLAVDLSGNIAVASDPYSKAQDAASEVRLFQGEAYYDTTRGVPYWASILGKNPPLSLMKSKFNSAALRVPGVTRARSFIAATSGRVVSGQVQISDKTGAISAGGF